MSTTPNIVAPWIPFNELPTQHPELAQTEDAARWQRRVLEPELLKHQALTSLCGRLYVHPERWAQAALEGGMRMLSTKKRRRAPVVAGDTQ